MRGRKNTPTHLKVLQGNPGRRPLNKAEPTFSDDLPEPPSWLPDGAKEYFSTVRDRIAEMGYASVSHTEALALLALLLDEVRQCTDAIEKGSGLTYSTERGEKTYPEVVIRHEAAKHAQSRNAGLNFLSEMGPAQKGNARDVRSVK